MIGILLTISCLLFSIYLGDMRLVSLEVLCLVVVVFNELEKKAIWVEYIRNREQIEEDIRQEKIRSLNPFGR